MTHSPKFAWHKISRLGVANTIEYIVYAEAHEARTIINRYQPRAVLSRRCDGGGGGQALL